MRAFIYILIGLLWMALAAWAITELVLSSLPIGYIGILVVLVIIVYAVVLDRLLRNW